MAIRAAADMQAYPYRAPVRDVINYTIEVPIGASGAVGTVVAPLPEITVTKNGTGTYDVVVPPCTRLAMWFTVLSADATPTMINAIPIARSATEGTFSFITVATIAGGAADAQNGDTVLIQIIAETTR